MNLRKLITNPLIICLFLYISALVLINPLGEYVVNDDWAHTRQVEAFLNKSYRIQANTDAVLILQAVMGFAVSTVFGFTLANLKILVIVLSIFLLIGIYQIARLFKLSAPLSFVLLITVAFNPLILHLGSVFMTDVPFLTFFTWTLYFYLRALLTENKRSELAGGILCGLSILIRQAGLIPFIAYSVTKIVNSVISKKKLGLSFYISEMFVVIGFVLYVIWPRYSSAGAGSFGSITNLLADSIRFRDIANQFGSLLTSIIYFGFFSFPLILACKFNLSKVKKVIIAISGMLMSYWAYISNIFPEGNVLYLEGLYAKTTRILELSLLNNNAMKLFLALIIGIAVAKMFLLILKTKYKNSPENQFLVLSFLGSLGILLFANDFYDRYLLPAGIVLLVFVARNVADQMQNKIIIGLILSLYIFISTSLVYDYTQSIKLKWQAAAEITKQTGIKSKIYVDGTYTKYQSAKKTKDFTGLTYINSTEKYLCYVDNIKIQNRNSLETFLSNTNVFTANIFGQPKDIEGLKNKQTNPSVEEINKTVIFSKEFYSPMYNWAGKTNTIKGWCTK